MTKIQPFSGTCEPPPLDTLAQPRKSGVDNLKKRARGKWYTSKIAGTLLQLDSPLKQYYRNAYYCGHTIEQQGYTLKSKYCKTRCCNVCNRIRTAFLMNTYVGQLGALENLQFVTLTIRNVEAENLADTLRDMVNTERMIRDRMRKRGIKLSGIRKVECTYNHVANTYHPHLHILVNGHGEDIVDAWLEKYPDTARKIGQDCRPADADSLNELFKYTTKVIAKSKCKRGEMDVHVLALDVIFQAMKGMRSIQPFGIVRAKDEDEAFTQLASVDYTDIPEYEAVTWLWEGSDWVYESTGECLSGYTPPDISFRFFGTKCNTPP